MNTEHVCVYIYIYIYIYNDNKARSAASFLICCMFRGSLGYFEVVWASLVSSQPSESLICVSLRPISALRFWISEGLTQAESLILRGWNSHVHRGFSRSFESTNLGRNNLSREVGCRGSLSWVALLVQGYLSNAASVVVCVCCFPCQGSP